MLKFLLLPPHILEDGFLGCKDVRKGWNMRVPPGSHLFSLCALTSQPFTYAKVSVTELSFSIS